MKSTTDRVRFEIVSVCKGGGYMYCRTSPPHPKANAKGLYPLHRVIAENKLGRLLKPNEVVHHIDEDKSNNDEANLAVMTVSAHTQLHKPKSEQIRCICPVCGASFKLEPHRYRLRKKRRGENEPCCSRACGGIASNESAGLRFDS